ncbi:hypothetical protein [Mycobacterium tuberculosis]|uniref:hypothetical protein n=1 Tax=Mycobacterium tuberculosis TaxID=1773 RepID=UPI00272ACCCA|nr:hypothetical protein [Mycobacterium tuberculosis]
MKNHERFKMFRGTIPQWNVPPQRGHRSLHGTLSNGAPRFVADVIRGAAGTAGRPRRWARPSALPPERPIPQWNVPPQRGHRSLHGTLSNGAPRFVADVIRVDILRRADAVYIDQIRRHGLYDEIWQAFAAILPSRHPFPGPGLAIRCPGEITTEKLDILRRADAVYIDQIRRHGLYDEIWQAFAAILPNSGTIEKILDPETKPDAVCDKCTDERKGQPVLGKTIDDASQKEKSLVRIREVNGVYSGTIEKILDPETKPDAVCDKCTDERKGQPVLGTQDTSGRGRKT